MNEMSQYKLQYEVFVKILQNHINFAFKFCQNFAKPHKFCQNFAFHQLFELMKSKIAFFGKNQFLMGMLGEF